jgi:hypothetical protein
MIIVRRSPPVISSIDTIVGFIKPLRAAIVSSPRPCSSIVGATCAIPSRVSTPRIVRTGASRPGIRMAMEQATSASTVRRLDRVVMSGREHHRSTQHLAQHFFPVTNGVSHTSSPA